MSKKDIVSVCAWCPDKIEKTKEAEEKGKTVSHGICERCVKILESE